MVDSPSQDDRINQALVSSFGSKEKLAGIKKTGTSSLNANQLRNMLASITSLPATTEAAEEFDLDAEMQAVKNFEQKYPSHFQK